MSPPVGTTTPPPVNWRGLTAAEPEAVAAASMEAEIFVRALAAYGVVIDADAVPSELDDRQSTLRAKLWGPDPLEGYGLHASLGAYLVTKVAVDLVPTGHLGLRPEHLRPEGVRTALVDQGLSASAAGSVVGDWAGPPPGFQGDPAGLGLSMLSGLAARTLTREERTAALAQVAASPRDLARLAASAGLLAAVRMVLPLLPIPSLGPAYDLAVVGLSVGRGDRVAKLLDPPIDVFHAALQEMGAASAALVAGQPWVVESDEQVAIPTALAADLWTDDDDDDVLDIVEEGPLVSVCQWRDGAVRLDDLDIWQSRLQQWQAAGGTLGLRIPAPEPTVSGSPVPPEAGLVRLAVFPPIGEESTDRIELTERRYSWRGDPLDALAPVVRAAVRIIAAAAEGQAPMPGVLDRAGDLAWLVRRATALASVVTGDLHQAVEVTRHLPPGAAPERRWAQDRLRRFGDHMPLPAEPEESRPMGAALIGDLAHQVARTITGTVPRERT